MKEERKYLVEEISDHLAKSNYVYLTNYDRITVAETTELRESLSEHTAEFHVVKNRIFGIALKSRELPKLSEECLKGPTAIIVGGENPSGVAKALFQFSKAKSKLEVKGGVVGDRVMTVDEIKQLSQLPGLEALRAQMLGILSAPAQRVVSVLSAIPQQILHVFQAREKQEKK